LREQAYNVARIEPYTVPELAASLRQPLPSRREHPGFPEAFGFRIRAM